MSLPLGLQRLEMLGKRAGSIKFLLDQGDRTVEIDIGATCQRAMGGGQIENALAQHAELQILCIALVA
jgi:hypothetical protein